VTLAADEAERLDASLNSRAKTKHVFRPAALTVEPGGLGVWLDGMRVGDLSGAYLRVKEAARAGFPLTCLAELRRDPGRGFRLEVFVPG
jgi:hypothetical protein